MTRRGAIAIVTSSTTKPTQTIEVLLGGSGLTMVQCKVSAGAHFSRSLPGHAPSPVTKSHSHLIRVRASPRFLVPEVDFLHWRLLHYTPRIQTCRCNRSCPTDAKVKRSVRTPHIPTPSLQCSETSMLSKESLSTRLPGSSKVSAMWED
jgi:hypothetical protein